MALEEEKEVVYRKMKQSATFKECFFDVILVLFDDGDE